MPVPYQALIPLFGIAGSLLAGFKSLEFFLKRENLGKPQRTLIDLWDEQLMHRNRVLTGHSYGQTDELYAPEVYSRSDPVYLEKTLF